MRWNYLIGGRLGLLPSFETVVIADFLNIVLPARIGDVSKLLYLKRYYSYDTHKTLSVLFIERFLDINVLAGFAIIVSLFYTTNERLKVALIVLLSFIVLTIFLIKTKVSFKLLSLLPVKKVKEYIIKVVEGIDKRLTMKSLWVSIIYTSLLWLTYFIKNIVFFKYAANFQLNLFQIFILFAVSTVSFVIPVTPGGVGTYQATVVFVATFYGIGKEEALASGIVLQVIQILTTSICFLFVLFRKGFTFKVLKKSLSEDG